MSAPTTAVRLEVYARDGWRCINCGARHDLSFQHRRATGMGGSTIRPTVEDGLTACVPCNVEFERSLQREALRFGHKVQRWVQDPGRVPVFEKWSGAWWVLDGEGDRWQVSADVALRLMEAVYGAEAYAGWVDAA